MDINEKKNEQRSENRETINDIVVQKIKEYRVKHGLNQEGMALQLNISFATLQRYEEKKKPVSIEVMDKLAGLYGQTIRDFLNEIEMSESEIRKQEFFDEIWDLIHRFREII